jgi:hypothetical protein
MTSWDALMAAPQYINLTGFSPAPDDNAISTITLELF